MSPRPLSLTALTRAAPAGLEARVALILIVVVSIRFVVIVTIVAVRFVTLIALSLVAIAFWVSFFGTLSKTLCYHASALAQSKGRRGFDPRVPSQDDCEQADKGILTIGPPGVADIT